MSLLIVVKTCDFTLVFLLFSLLVSELGRVDSDGQNSRIPGIPPVFILLLLFIFSGLIKRLEILVRIRYGGLKSLEVIPAMYCPLGLNFVGGSMSWSIFSKTIQVCLSYIRTWS